MHVDITHMDQKLSSEKNSQEMWPQASDRPGVQAEAKAHWLWRNRFPTDELAHDPKL